MQLTVSGKQVELSDSLRVHVSDHLDVITNKYFDHALQANVTFSKARSFFTCDINVHAGRGVTVRGEGEAGDARAAFDDAAEHIAKRLRRYRRRVNEHARSATPPAQPEAGKQYILRDDEIEDVPAPAINGHAHAVEPDTLHATIIAESDTLIETLTVRDAVMRLDLSFQQVMMFRNEKNNQLNVVYRRSDGHIGWIDPTA
ncbi:MAG: ribosomal subunit interface protein [Acidocella sp. 20-57-95]|nr:MAG: ribosomal subunit interface protein [Acidocella sp. 20-57-95]OYV59208.1 MAG: ribosomal subunit interface protein [Acidocella sp. 21-58-7]HQT64693.1 ribosome-associated translation inhibitor RaiA [Acidocella sp.]HQU04529.1 ribosome-associated translation inhibitor RaiA [Acidocella sp.]